MKPGDEQPKLEDLLSNDGPSSAQPADPAQQELAAAVQRMIVNAGQESWDPSDKASLWNNIAGQLVPQHFRYRYLFVKVAAAILVLLAIGAWWLWPRQHSALVQFAQQHRPAENTTDTRLILGQNKSVVVQGKNSSLVYAGSGVTINANNTPIPAEEYNTLIVPYGRRSRVQLEDGTVVFLNAGSRLVYPATFKQHKREVYLEGEGFFDIAPNAAAPFYVYAYGVATEVLGTTFNVSAYPDDARQSVVLVSGSVRLHLQHGLFGKQTRELQPAEMGLLEDDALEVSHVNVNAYTAWKEGRLLNLHTPLKDILKKLTRYYNIKLDLDSLQPGLETFSGDLDLDENLENVLDIICAANSLRYERQGKGFVLKEKD
ncbi:MAG: FecR domain-containing protein [Chitinophaga sp.]|uniref:FecR family protein n=1 Tax=Chitinophaga sp. TaxID=1869181 RepID=UPI001B2DC63D|nr:FecR domain-containing protein [Chitinophaga sp.]MBO9728854.1 FecR domain-containing protein [Chitinophaga sp.]